MIEKKGTETPPHLRILTALLWGVMLLLIIAGACFLFFKFTLNCIDGCGPYHNAASAADLDGDGDLDVVLSNLRHESEFNFWAGPTLWYNQGGGRFRPSRVSAGGPFTTAGDVDGDGNVDLVRLVYNGVEFHLNDGEQDVQGDRFRTWFGVRSQENVFYPGSHGSIQLGDLNNDGWLDVFVGDCCGVLMSENGKETYFPSLAWLWLNTLDENNRQIRQGQTGQSLSALGDLPMRLALGDLDGDGDLDVFAAIQPPKRGGSYVSADRVLLNDGSGRFSDSGQRLTESGQLSNRSGGLLAPLQAFLRQFWAKAADEAGSTAVALGDLDNDGDLDALVGKSSGAAVWINQGGAQAGQAGFFSFSGQRLPGGSSEAVFLADLDGDADLDALVAGKSQAAAWWNDGRGNFRDSGQRLGISERHGITIGDFNNDGFTDVFTAAGDVEFHLWLNQGDGILQED